MAPLIPIAVSLASKFIPELIGKALDSDTAEKVATKVMDVAITATGREDPKEALEIWDPDTSPELKEKLRADILSLVEMQIKDVQHAREFNKYEGLTENVAYGIMYGNLVLIACLIGLFARVASSSLTVSAASTLSAIIGGALNQLYQERQQVTGYLFGSAVGSKLKDLLKK